MIFKQISVGNMQNFCYIIGDDESKDAAIIDAGFEPEKLANQAKQENDVLVRIISHSKGIRCT